MLQNGAVSHQHARMRLSFLLAFFVVFAGLGADVDPDPGDMQISIRGPETAEKIISRLVADLISRHHYLRRKLDDEVAKQWFEEYFRQLDHNHIFFLASDIEEFSSYRTTLDDLILRQGDLSFAFDVYERFVLRVQEWYRFTKTHVDQSFDFTKQETILLDRRKEPWPTSRLEQEDLWRRRLKNSIIAEELVEDRKQRKLELDEEAKTGQKDENSKEQNATAPEIVDTVLVNPEQGAANLKQSNVHKQEPETKGLPERAEVTEKTVTETNTEKVLAEPVQDETPTEKVRKLHARYLKRKMELDPMEVVEVFLSSLTKVYDPHSVYMGPETEEDFDISMSLSLQGIGAVLTIKDSYVEVVSIVPGGPADKDGHLKPGDQIVAVAQDGEPPVDVIDMPLRGVVRLIRGPRETTVYLTVMAGGSSTRTVIDIVRGEVKLTEQEAKSESRVIPLPKLGNEPQTGNVTVLFLPSFYADFAAKQKGDKDYKSSTRDVKKLLVEASRDTLDGVVLDLRSNGGGSLDEAISLAGLFFDQGPVVQVRKANGRVRKRFDPEEGSSYDGPLIVMVDKFSASASEIVAAALQDYGRAVIIGDDRTHGKGTVQTIYHLDSRLGNSPIFKDRKCGSLKFTMAKFYRVNGNSTQVRGVQPDIIFPSFADHMDVGEAKLRHAMPWDEIESLEINRAVDVGNLLDVLRQHSEQRRGTNEMFQDYMAEVKLYAERQERKTLTLNRQKRIALQEEEEVWSKKMRRFTSRRRSTPGKEAKTVHSGKDAEEEDFPDLVLDETMRIMGDLIVMTRGKQLHTATAVPPPERGTTSAIPGQAVKVVP